MKTTGFTLLEMMIALCLSLMIISSVLTVVIHVRKTHKVQQRLHDQQEDGQFALQYLSARIQMTGYAHCRGTGEWVDNQGALIGYAQSQIPLAIKRLTHALSDVLIIHRCVTYQNKQQWLGLAYYVADTGRVDSRHQPILALYEKPLNGRRKVLIEPVKSLFFYYGLSRLAASAVNDWDAVKGVEIVFNNGLVWHLLVALRER